MTTTKTCPVCGEHLAPERVARYPASRTCGVPACAKEHGRLQGNKHRNNYRRRKASDPAVRVLEIQRRRARYVRERLRLGKTPAVREPVAPERGASDTFLSVIRRNALTALRWAGLRDSYKFPMCR